MSDRIVIPEYPIPKDLENVLDKTKYSSESTYQKYSKIMQVLKNVKSIDISEKHYLQLLKLALYLEEYQSNKEMKKYELFSKSIDKVQSKDGEVKPTTLFRITVDDLDEERPWVRPNDYVDVIDTYDNKLYTLRVTNVALAEIIANDDDARLCNIHTPEKLYDIKFRFQNYPIRCAHYGLRLMSARNTVNYLFPYESKSYITKDNQSYSAFETINPNIAGNPEQQQAILNIVNRSSFPAPYILYGPPGTGKTATLVEAICQIHNNTTNRVLVCTPSNTAGDEIARRLLEFLKPSSIYRMYSQSKDGSTIDEALIECSNIEKKTVVLPKTEDLKSKRIVITTLCNSTRLIIMRIASDHFSHVFIDEAGQGTEADILIPIGLVSACGQLNSQIVFAGDPQQLGPTVISKLAETILGRSILERLMSYDTYQKDSNNKYNPKFITKLLQNYRSHPDIIHVSNQLFYDAELIAKCPRAKGKYKFPIIFHGVKGKEEKCFYSPSVCNYQELRIVLNYVDDLLRNQLGFGKVTAKDIGIVTPFTLQSKKIKKALKDKKLKDINVGTVELFQGQERKIMIMTTVRSKTFNYEGKEHIGFLSNPKRFNVAITRAKQLMIIVGHPNILQIDDKWRYLIKFCMDNNSYRGVRFSLQRFSDNRDNVPTDLVKSDSLFDKQLLFYDDEDKVTDLMDQLHIFD